MDTVLNLIWQIANSPAAIAALGAALVWLLAKLYAAKPTWQAFEGTIIAAVKWAEKTIPDDASNTAEQKLNAAMQYVLKVYESARGTPATPAVQQDLAEGIQIVHAQLEASGNLDPAPQSSAPTSEPVTARPEA